MHNLDMKVKWLVSERRNGNARIKRQLFQLLRRRKWPVKVAAGRQVHGDKIAIISKAKDVRFWQGKDGYLTDQLNVPIGIFTADCLSVFLNAGNAIVVGVLHAGWRGVRGRILHKAVQSIRRKWGIPASQIEVWTGPSIGACCFEVGWDVAKYFPSTRFKKYSKWRVDLDKEIKLQAKKLGLRWELRRDVHCCTMHEKRYHSFRRDKTDARQISMIMK